MGDPATSGPRDDRSRGGRARGDGGGPRAEWPPRHARVDPRRRGRSGPGHRGVTLVRERSVTATGVGDATHAHQADAAPAHRPAPTIAGYRIEGELGRGAMGVVYRARQVRLNRPCALKVILAGAHADPVAAVRFLGEAEAVAKLQHPNIVQIHHIGEADGLPFLELEYVEGGSLDRTARRHPLAGAAGGDAGRGAGPRRRRGAPAGDRPPRPEAGNILLAADGTPKVADFGLAKSLDAESGLTATESILGTPSYMAPEQAEGKAKQVGPLADVYALGAILYELLVGRPPFRGTTVLETLEQVKTAEPVPPSRLVPGAAARRRDDRAEVPAEGPGQAVRVGRGAGRGPAAVPGGPADPGAAGLLGRAAAPLGPPEQGSWPACSRAWS